MTFLYTFMIEPEHKARAIWLLKRFGAYQAAEYMFHNQYPIECIIMIMREVAHYEKRSRL